MACTYGAAALLVVAAVMCCRAQGSGVCQPSDIDISLRTTGKVVEGQPEYLVTIANRCRCPQLDVRVRCLRLPSVEKVDESKIRAVDDELCLVAGGGPVVRGSPVEFTYAWKTPQSFTFVSARPEC
ncbi:hypothetical protein ACP70R_002707 [Stipagrostis hirtigluma subsp. patula]